MRRVNDLALGLILSLLLLSLVMIVDSLRPAKDGVSEWRWITLIICITCQLYAGTRNQKP